MTNEQIALLERCEELAYSENILDVLAEEIKQWGFAGDAKLPKLVFLTLYTGFLSRPVSLLIKGPSGAGKSYSLRQGKQFVPEKAYEAFEGMTDKALVYLKDLNLKHKHLIIGEAAGMSDEGNPLLRQLLSEGKVRYVTVQQTADGLKGTELPRLEGPCGLIMTTTRPAIHPEDESRMLSVNITESPEQIREALLAQAFGLQDEEEPIDFDPWFALYDYVGTTSKKVLIPYAKDIAERLPIALDRIKRDFPHIRSLIAASALLHSCRREVRDDGTIVANRADYELVIELTNDALSEGLRVAVPPNLRQVVEAVREIENAKNRPDRLFDKGVSQGKLAEFLDRDPSTINRWVNRAVKEEFLTDLNPGQGRISRLTVGERELPARVVLPPANELFV